jgi:hypothetical protein
MINNKQSENKLNSCIGCGKGIDDQYIFTISPDIHWHEYCLKCTLCFCKLESKCYFKDGKAYCKSDFQRYQLNYHK